MDIKRTLYRFNHKKGLKGKEWMDNRLQNTITHGQFMHAIGWHRWDRWDSFCMGNDFGYKFTFHSFWYGDRKVEHYYESNT